jgi:citrate synthase
MSRNRYLTAREVAAELGITTATLYAYVSRGLIHSEPTPGGKRDRRYRAEDVERLRNRQESRRDPTIAAREALHWGAPVLESSISLIDSGRLHYRGFDATVLAREASVEEVAALIWTGEMGPGIVFEAATIPMPHVWRKLRSALDDLSAVERFQIALPMAAADDVAAFDTRPEVVRSVGVRMLQMLVGIASSSDRIVGGVARTLATAWAPGSRAATDLISSSLILAADHELNVSAFTVRCVASAGATPYAAVNAGLSALQGTKHGGHTERVEALLREIGRPSEAPAVIASRLRRGEGIPGFGHPLYPSGDPRGALLLARALESAPRSPKLKLICAVVDAVRESTGAHPTIDLGLVAVSLTLGLPTGAPMVLFALGRAIGWVGHAIEQYSQDRIIRPRAQYTGPPPRAMRDGDSAG